tara:strand:+ start:1084 stop:1209 length:126 start_codon:yes stop_codon:yes gene_type:complete
MYNNERIYINRVKKMMSEKDKPKKKLTEKQLFDKPKGKKKK